MVISIFNLLCGQRLQYAWLKWDTKKQGTEFENKYQKGQNGADGAHVSERGGGGAQRYVSG